MRVLELISDSVKPANEDACGYRAEGAWVIDGATALEQSPLIDGVSAAAWLSHTASAILGALAWDDRSLPEILAATIERLADLGDTHGLTGPAFPTAAISLVRHREGRLEVCSLGDCSVVVSRLGGKPVDVADPQFEGAEASTLARVRDRLNEGVPPADAYREIRAELLERRRSRNSPAGLWVLGSAPEAAWHAGVESVPAPPGSDIVLMTDGYSRCVWPFGLVPDTADLMEQVTTGGAADLLSALRAAEAADPDCARVPRFGTHDDATILWAHV